MEVPVLEPYVEVLDRAEENLESKESCSSLARSDSGQGKSLSSVDFHEENIPPDDTKRLEATTEIDDQLPNVISEETTPVMTSDENAFSDHARAVSSVCTNPDSGIEKSPMSENFTFLNKSSNLLQEFNSNDDMRCRKQQKDIFEGPVSDLTNVSQGKSGKSSLQRQNSFDIFNCSLDFSSLEKDKPINELCSNNINPSPEVSILSSADCNGKCCHLVSTAQTQFVANTAHRFGCSPYNHVLHKMHAQTDVNGYHEQGNTANAYIAGIQSGCGQFLTSTLPESDIFNCHLPPQGMVSKSTMDKVIKELTMARRKISELEYENLNLRENNVLLRENRAMYENWQLQLQRLPAPHPDVDFWKKKYFETKEQLEIKEDELQSKQAELQSKQDELQSKQDELQSKQDELQSKQDELNLRSADLARLEAIEEESQRQRFLNEGLQSQAPPSDEDQELQNLLHGAVRLRPDLSSLDETLVKTV